MLEHLLEVVEGIRANLYKVHIRWYIPVLLYLIEYTLHIIIDMMFFLPFTLGEKNLSHKAIKGAEQEIGCLC